MPKLEVNRSIEIIQDFDGKLLFELKRQKYFCFRKDFCIFAV